MMPRPRPPPTPSSPISAPNFDRCKQADLESSFELPPPAIREHKRTTSRTISRDNLLAQRTPPMLPQDRQPGSSPRHKRTWSGVAKQKPEDEVMATSSKSLQSDSLPPPPSRARKIIHMKPKTASKATTTKSDPFTGPTTTATPPSATTPKSTTSPPAKRKQPSGTSAAGRKIARKTAHSIIERRRRSKMNEEFGVLKDMIPACVGVEMHKLAILQAGIEYVRYLEGCILQLKGEKEQALHEAVERNRRKSKETLQMGGTTQDDDRDMDDDEDMDDSSEGDDEDEEEPNEGVFDGLNVSSKRPHLSVSSQTTSRPQTLYRQVSSGVSTATQSPYRSPCMHPLIGHSSIDHSRNNSVITAASPSTFSTRFQPSSGSLGGAQTPTFLSPAFSAIHFSPDLSRPSTMLASSTANRSSPNSRSTTPRHHFMSATGPALPQLSIPQPALPLSSFPSSSTYTSLLNRNPDSKSPSASASASASEAGSPIRTQTALSGIDSQSQPKGRDVSADAEMRASAALMMMTTHDRRGTGLSSSLTTSTAISDSISRDDMPHTTTNTHIFPSSVHHDSTRGSGTNTPIGSSTGRAMSVRDLLSS